MMRDISPGDVFIYNSDFILILSIDEKKVFVHDSYYNQITSYAANGLRKVQYWIAAGWKLL